jgi:hypothetical protein
MRRARLTAMHIAVLCPNCGAVQFNNGGMTTWSPGQVRAAVAAGGLRTCSNCDEPFELAVRAVKLGSG